MPIKRPSHTALIEPGIYLCYSKAGMIQHVLNGDRGFPLHRQPACTSGTDLASDGLEIIIDSVKRLCYALAMKSNTVFERWAERVRWTPQCWFWEGTLTTAGYGHFNFQSRCYIAHRVAYELFIGPIPDGLQIDHLCRVHSCVNPAHLEAVTCKQNLWRGDLKERFGWGQCPHGYQRKRDCYDCREVYRARYEAKQ